MSRSGRSYTNVAVLVRTPQPPPSADGALAGATSPVTGTLTGDVTLPFRPPTIVVSLRPPPPRPNFMTLIRAPQPAVIDDGALAGGTPPASGALTGDVVDSGALVGTTPSSTGALTGDVAQTARPAAVLVVTAPRPAVYNSPGGLLTVGPVAVSDIDGALAGTTSPAVGALTGDVIDAGALAGATSPAVGALAGDVAQPSRPSTVLVVSSALAAARRPVGLRLATSVPTEVSGVDDGALAGTFPMPTGQLTGTAAQPPRPPAVFVVSVVRHAAYAFPGGLLTVAPVAPDTADTGTLAGATSPATGALTGDVVITGALAGTTSPSSGALTGDVVDAGVLAGSTSPVSAALTTSTVIAGDLAGTTSPTSGALTGEVTRLGPSPVLVATRPFPRRAYVTATLVRTAQQPPAVGALAGTTSPAVGALLGDVIDSGALAGSTPPVSSALTTSSTVTGALAASTPKPSGALTATSYYAATLAGTTAPTAGALAGTEYITGAAAGTAPVLVGALAGHVVDAGTLAGTALLPVAAFNRAPVIHYPLHAGAPVDHITRYRAGTAVDNAAHYQAGEPT